MAISKFVRDAIGYLRRPIRKKRKRDLRGPPAPSVDTGPTEPSIERTKPMKRNKSKRAPKWKM